MKTNIELAGSALVLCLIPEILDFSLFSSPIRSFFKGWSFGAESGGVLWLYKVGTSEASCVVKPWNKNLLDAILQRNIKNLLTLILRLEAVLKRGSYKKVICIINASNWLISEQRMINIAEKIISKGIYEINILIRCYENLPNHNSSNWPLIKITIRQIYNSLNDFWNVFSTFWFTQWRFFKNKITGNLW